MLNERTEIPGLRKTIADAKKQGGFYSAADLLYNFGALPQSQGRPSVALQLSQNQPREGNHSQGGFASSFAFPSGCCLTHTLDQHMRDS